MTFVNGITRLLASVVVMGTVVVVGTVRGGCIYDV